MFENYDSSSFPTLEESIAHSKENPFISTNFSAKLAIGDYLIVDPNSALKTFIDAYSDSMQDVVLNSDEMYAPEKVALRLYGSSDFWFILMIINKIPSVFEFNVATIKALPVNLLYKIETLLLNNNNQEFTESLPVYKLS
jgi:hypothetical protein